MNTNQPPPWAWRSLLCAYVAGAVLAFGHASNNCTISTGQRLDGSRFEIPETYPFKVIGATILWPLYVANIAFAKASAQVEKP